MKKFFWEIENAVLGIPLSKCGGNSSQHVFNSTFNCLAWTGVIDLNLNPKRLNCEKYEKHSILKGKISEVQFFSRKLDAVTKKNDTKKEQMSVWRRHHLLSVLSKRPNKNFEQL